MRRYSVELCHQYSDVFDTERKFSLQTHHFFNPNHISMFAVHRRHIVQPVNKRNDLIIGKLLGVLLKTTVQVTEVWNNLFHNLAIHQNLKS